METHAPPATLSWKINGKIAPFKVNLESIKLWREGGWVRVPKQRETTSKVKSLVLPNLCAQNFEATLLDKLLQKKNPSRSEQAHLK